MRPTAVVFDLDGTLVDSMGLFLNVYTNAIRVLGGPTVNPHDVVAAFHAGSTQDVLSHFLGRAVTDTELDHFYRMATEAARSVAPFDGITEMLDELAASRVALGVFTGATRRTTELLLQSCGLAHHFGSLVAGDEVRRPKPSPEGLLAVCDRLRVPPSRVAYVGDTLLDLECARAAGCLAVTAGWSEGSTRAEDADLVATTPADLSRLLEG